MVCFKIFRFINHLSYFLFFLPLNSSKKKAKQKKLTFVISWHIRNQQSKNAKWKFFLKSSDSWKKKFEQWQAESLNVSGFFLVLRPKQQHWRASVFCYPDSFLQIVNHRHRHRHRQQFCHYCFLWFLLQLWKSRTDNWITVTVLY